MPADLKPPETPQNQIYGRLQSSSTSASPAFVPPETPVKSQMNIIPKAANLNSRFQMPVAPVTEFVTKPTSSTGSTGAIPQTVQKEVTLDGHHSQPLTPVADSPAFLTAGIKRKSEAVNCSPYLQNSPFHVSTPESPYGQVFQTPTSDSKKRWKKWIDSFPDFQGENPLPAQRQRRQSTVYVAP